MKIPNVWVLLLSQRKIFIVFVVSLALALALAAATWDMQFWPSDEKAYYFDATVQLPHLRYLSDIHKAMDTQNVRWLHGKEILILCLSWMQRLTNDFTTIRPFVLLFIIANFFSSVFVYLIARRFWGERSALVAYLAFTGSLWPYLYILFAKHQPLGLVFFLLSFYLLQKAKPEGRHLILYGLAGTSLGLSVFSSTVASLYFPFFIAGFFYLGAQDCRGVSARWEKITRFTASGIMVLVGILAVMIYVNWPDVGHNIKSYLDYVAISGTHNHFYYAQPYLQQWFGVEPVAKVRGGVEWIIRYFFVIMPVLFPVYLSSVVFLVVLAVRNKDLRFALKNFGVVALSLTPLLMAELARVAQDGGNYFPSIIGIVFLVGYAAYRFEQARLACLWQPFWRRTGMFVGLGIVMAHVATSVFVFMSDVYPCRLAMTYFSRTLFELKVERIAAHVLNPHRYHFMTTIAPSVAKKLSIQNIAHLAQARQGHIMMPPLTGDSIYIPATSHYTDFDSDGFLNELRRKGVLRDYAVASFRTLANSRIWLHEEEILSYRKLILRHPIGEDDEGGRIWLLDAARIARDFKTNIPTNDSIFIEQNSVRNIGTRSRVYVFQGFPVKIKDRKSALRLASKIYKVGNPSDAIRAFVYKLDEAQPVWIPIGKRFFSDPVSGATLENKHEGSPVIFDFKLSQPLNPGFYFFVIYRTGSPDDQNYYRIYTQIQALL